MARLIVFYDERCGFCCGVVSLLAKMSPPEVVYQKAAEMEHLAVIVALPLPSAVTRPPEDTVATVVSSLSHAMSASDMVWPLASLAVALSRTVASRDRSVVDEGLTEILDTRWLTVTDAVPDLPPDLAVIVALPLPSAVTRPPEDTVATVVSSLSHAMSASDMVWPLASLAVALSRTVASRDRSVVDEGLTEILDTRWLTVTDAVPDLPPDLAVIVALPLPSAVTRPPEDTVATVVSSLSHAMSASDMVWPLASLAVALSRTVASRDRSVVDEGLTEILDTRWLTVTDAVPDLPPDLAVIVALPLPSAVTRPPEDTVATVVSSLSHAMSASDMVWPLASLAVALSRTVASRDRSVVDEGLTEILDTRWLTVTDAVPDLPPDLAVIVALPLPSAVTRPPEDTVATVVSSLSHAMSVSDMVWPLASLAVALSRTVASRDRSVVDEGLTEILDTRWLTVTDTVPDALTSCFSDVALIVAVPLLLAVTRPLEETVATDVLLLDHVMSVPDMT